VSKSITTLRIIRIVSRGHFMVVVDRQKLLHIPGSELSLSVFLVEFESHRSSVGGHRVFQEGESQTRWCETSLPFP
jgi:hypothetical protein